MMIWSESEYPTTIPEPVQIVLDKVKIGAKAYLSPEIAESVRTEVAHDIANRLLITVTAKVLAEELPPEHLRQTRFVEFQAPATWWQHWKLDHSSTWWARWIAKAWPVRMRNHVQTIDFDVDLRRFRKYPESKVALSRDFGNVVLGHTLDHSTTVRRTP